MAALLELDGIGLRLGERQVLDGLRLEIGPREIHALLGANGSGKSSLAYLIMGCEGYAPRTGSLRFDAQEIATLPIHERARRGITLVQGRVGQLEIDYAVFLGARASAELVARVYGRVADEIGIKEAVRLQGEHSRGLVKTRVAVDDEATAEVVGITEGNADGPRGHVDCTEIVRGRGRVSASPRVSVSHPGAKVTHEAAIGSVDRRQLETLMAHGLAPEEAVEVIVRGLLR